MTRKPQHSTTLFRVPLDDLLLDDRGIPTFLPVVCDYLMNFSGTVGIFRLCGDHTIVQALGTAFNFPQCAVPPCASVHDVSSFLKQWLRDLPTPLIPPSLVNSQYDPSDDSTVASLLRALPPANRRCLALIFAVIQLVLDQSAVNQMAPANIATCFAGSLLQNSKGLTRHFPFARFFTAAMQHINAAGDDFVPS